MSGAGIDPSQRAEVLLLRGDELLESRSPESLDEAVLAYEGAKEVATDPAVGEELRHTIDERLRAARERLEKGAGGSEEPQDGEPASE